MISKEALDAALEAYFGEITENRFWNKNNRFFKKAVPFKDGAALHHTAVDLIMGCPEKGINAPSDITSLREVLSSIYTNASRDHKWEAKRSSSLLAERAAHSAMKAAMDIEGISENISM